MCLVRSTRASILDTIQLVMTNINHAIMETRTRKHVTAGSTQQSGLVTSGSTDVTDVSSEFVTSLLGILSNTSDASRK